MRRSDLFVSLVLTVFVFTACHGALSGGERPEGDAAIAPGSSREDPKVRDAAANDSQVDDADSLIAGDLPANDIEVDAGAQPVGHDLPKNPQGHYLFIGNESGGVDRHDQIKSELDRMHASAPYDASARTGWRGALVKIRWDKYETSKGTFDGEAVGYLEELYNKCDQQGTLLQVVIWDIAFGLSASNASPSKAQAPADIKSAGGTCVSGNVSNLAACAKLWEPWVADRYIAMVKDLHNRYKHHPSYRGVTLPETSRSFYDGPSTAAGKTVAGNFRNIQDKFFPEYKRIVEEINKEMMKGQDNGYLNYHINFMIGSRDYTQDLFKHAETLTGVEIGTPDFNYAWYSKNPDHGSKLVKAYDYMRDAAPQILVAPHVETRDAEKTPDNSYKLAYELGANSINPHVVYWFEWHPSSTSYGPAILSLLKKKGWKANFSTPANDQ